MLRSGVCQPVQFTLWESRLQPLINSMLAAQALAAARQAAGKLASGRKKLQNVALQCKLALSKPDKAPQ